MESLDQLRRRLSDSKLLRRIRPGLRILGSLHLAVLKLELALTCGCLTPISWVSYSCIQMVARRLPSSACGRVLINFLSFWNVIVGSSQKPSNLSSSSAVQDRL